MKIAYLILAHSNFGHLDRLAQQLSQDGDYVFIHLDKRAGAIPTLPHQNERIIFVEDRVKCFWASYGMVEAVNILMKAAFQRPDVDYFISLSGVDFPVRSVSRLKSFLARGGEYINFVKGTTENRPEAWFNKFYFKYERRARSHPKTRLFNLLEHYIHKLYTRKIPFQLYTGLDWFALSREAVGYILDVISKPNPYDKFFRHTYCTIEAYHQTILGNSGKSWKIQPSLTYTDWTKPEKPAYMEDEHVEFLKKHDVVDSPYGPRHVFFARKFHDGSEKVVERIIREIL